MIKTNIKNKLVVLAYHSITNEERFERQVKHLKKEFDLISLPELQGFFYTGGKLPAKPLLITFDDGDFSLYPNAFPVLKSNNIPAVIFVITGLIDSQKPFWWDEIEYYLGKETGNKKAWEVKKWPNREREEFLKEMRENSKKPEMKYRQLTKEQLREMNSEGIDIANHSHTHPMFDQCTSAELQQEMETSTAILNELNFTPGAFAYPNGNYSEIAENALKDSGMKLAFLFDHQLNEKKIHPLRISRLAVNDTTPFWKFKLILSGLHSRILPATRRIGKLMKN